MNVFLPLLILVALGSVAVVLGLGLVQLARGGSDRHRSNRLMQWRVVLQAVALVVMLVAVLLAKG